jgi:hypothetical protein
MGAAVIWENTKPSLKAEAGAAVKWGAAWFVELKAQIAQIALAKSLQQFGREEEKS